MPPGTQVRVGCCRIGCNAVGWAFPEGVACCHCGEPVNARWPYEHHSPVSMGPEPTQNGEVEGWCPDHGFWYFDLDGEPVYSPEHPGMRPVYGVIDGQAEPDQGSEF
jgi:hypothetical protein